MKIIGITGGIGSGKTIISNMLKEAGYPVFDCDSLAKHIYNTDASVISEMKKTFGDNIYKDSILDRKALSEIVFSDKTLLDKLNFIIHPKVKEQLFREIKESKSDLFFIESAILFESGLNKFTNKVLSLTAPVEVRIDRAMKRDNITKEKVEAKMKFQICEERRLSKSDYIISTNQDLEKIKGFLFRLVDDMK